MFSKVNIVKMVSRGIMVCGLLTQHQIFANESVVNPSIVGAIYQVNSMAKNGKKVKQKVAVWRNGDSIIYEYSDTGIAELWHRSLIDTKNQTKPLREYIQLIRFVDKYQKGIEYLSNELPKSKQSNQWQRLYHIVDPSILLTFKNEEKHQIESGHEVSSYTQGDRKLEWFDDIKLPYYFNRIRDSRELEWKLESLITTQSTVMKKFNQRVNYHVTDYADIGDNESDIYLSKMITMGFIE